MIIPSDFASDLITAYLRKLHYGPDGSLALTGDFEHNGSLYVWGSIVEYGEPPPGSAVVEAWQDGKPDETIHLRVWHAKQSDRGVKRLRNVTFEEYESPRRQPSEGTALLN